LSGEFGVVAELFVLDGGHREDGHLPELAEKVIQEVPAREEFLPGAQPPVFLTEPAAEELCCRGRVRLASPDG
jgi:hypothetical protein